MQFRRSNLTTAARGFAGARSGAWPGRKRLVCKQSLCLLLIVVLAGFSTSQLNAQEARDWPCFGGSPSRNLVSLSAKSLPETWATRAGDSPGNVLWSTRLGTRTFGSPVIAAGKIFIGTNNDAPRNPRDVFPQSKKPRDKGVLMCFRASDGKF